AALRPQRPSESRLEVVVLARKRVARRLQICAMLFFPVDDEIDARVEAAELPSLCERNPSGIRLDFPALTHPSWVISSSLALTRDRPCRLQGESLAEDRSDDADALERERAPVDRGEVSPCDVVADVELFTTQ